MRESDGRIVAGGGEGMEEGSKKKLGVREVRATVRMFDTYGGDGEESGEETRSDHLERLVGGLGGGVKVRVRECWLVG